MRLIAATLFFLTATAVSSAQQQVSVSVEDSEGRPLRGAIVAVLDSGGYVVNEGLTSAQGLRRFSVPAGPYSFHVRRIGYKPFISSRVALPQSGLIKLVVETPPIILNTIVVTAAASCGFLHETTPIGSVWNEVDKALRASQLSRNDLAALGTLTVYRRTNSAKGKVIGAEEKTFQLGDQRPFGSLDPGDLARNGYIRGDETHGWEYFAPDESVLLSNEFRETHCFHLARQTDHPGEIGIEFTPAKHRDVPDIRGSIWVDENSAELREIRFQFVTASLPATFNAEGYSRFRRMASGAWLVDKWNIRTPNLKAFGPRPDQIAALGFTDTGGFLTDTAQAISQAPHPGTLPLPVPPEPSISRIPDAAKSKESITGLPQTAPHADAESQLSARHTSLRGRVVDSGGLPLANVYLEEQEGHGFAITDMSGEFRLGSVTRGLSLLSLRKIGFSPLDTVVDKAGSDSDLLFQMSAVAAQTDTVVILSTTDYDRELDAAGFFDRFRHSIDGTFLTTSQIRRSNATKLTQLLSSQAGVRIMSMKGTNGRSFEVPVGHGGPRGNCPLGLVIDGQSLGYGGTDSIDDLIDPSSATAVEIYTSAAFVPVAFQTHAKGCGLVVVWTRSSAKTSK